MNNVTNYSVSRRDTEGEGLKGGGGGIERGPLLDTNCEGTESDSERDGQLG
jgi:hypothetical protein